jgi:hypothetical protein
LLLYLWSELDRSFTKDEYLSNLVYYHNIDSVGHTYSLYRWSIVRGSIHPRWPSTYDHVL